MTREIRVSVPASPQFVQILRTVVAAVAARLDFPFDAIEDLTIAVDEAGAQLLKASGGTGSLTLTAYAREGRIEVVVSVDCDVAQWPPEGHDRSLAWAVLTGLTDEATWERSESRPALRLAKIAGSEGATA